MTAEAAARIEARELERFAFDESAAATALPAERIVYARLQFIDDVVDRQRKAVQIDRCVPEEAQRLHFRAHRPIAADRALDTEAANDADFRVPKVGPAVVHEIVFFKPRPFVLADCNAERVIDERVAECETRARPQGREPIDLIVDEVVRRENLVALDAGAQEVGLDAEGDVALLPIMPDLPAIDGAVRVILMGPAEPVVVGILKARLVGSVA